MRIDRANGVIEVGNINYSPLLQRTPAATEAMFLMMRRVFDELGYRRYEWKCDSLNAPSRAAALRLGFQYEGLFRQAVVYKGRNRDTAWFSIIDSEWPALKRAYEQWLAPENFDAEGRQTRKLASSSQRHAAYALSIIARLSPRRRSTLERATEPGASEYGDRGVRVSRSRPTTARTSGCSCMPGNQLWISFLTVAGEFHCPASERCSRSRASSTSASVTGSEHCGPRQA